MPIVRATPVAGFTTPFNITGQPAISLPLHWDDDGLPIGVQLVAAYGREDVLLRRRRAARGGAAVGRPDTGPLCFRAVMSVTVVGSIAFDQVKTPSGERERMLGGSAVHFALAASFFDAVRVVGPVGDDFGEAEYDVLHARNVDTSDIEHVAGGKTFFWSGEYEENLNNRHTARHAAQRVRRVRAEAVAGLALGDVLFLANIQPDLQREVREQCADARFVAMDSMNLWIDIARDSLIETIRGVDCLMLNDDELRQLTGRPNLSGGARDHVARPEGRRRQAGRVRRGPHHRGLDFFALPAVPARYGDRPDRRRRLLRRRLHRLHRRPPRRRARRALCCAARWPTAPRSPRSTSRSSGPSGSSG